MITPDAHAIQQQLREESTANNPSGARDRDAEWFQQNQAAHQRLKRVGSGYVLVIRRGGRLQRIPVWVSESGVVE